MRFWRALCKRRLRFAEHAGFSPKIALFCGENKCVLGLANRNQPAAQCCGGWQRKRKLFYLVSAVS
jgi:hypothetical protein